MSYDDDYNFCAPGDYPIGYPPDKERNFLSSMSGKHEDSFRHLLDVYGCDNLNFYQGLNILQWAAKYDFFRGVEILCQRGLNPNAKGYEGYNSALDFAILNNNYEMARLLLAKGADANSTFKYSKGPMAKQVSKCSLGLALEEDLPHFVQLLLAHGANPNAYHDEEPLMTMAAKCCHPSVVDLLALYQGNVNVQDCDGNTALHIAALKGQEKLVQRLVKRYYADVCIKNNNQDMAMHLAVSRKNLGILKTLQQQGTPIFEVNCGGKSVVSLVVEQNDKKLLSCVFDHWLREFSFTDRKEWRLNRYLTDAARRQHIFSMEYLVRHVSDCNEVDADGKTALHYVCEHGFEEQFNILLPYLDRFDLNKQDYAGNTPIIYAAGCKNRKIFLTLLERGADPTIVNHKNIGVFDKAFRLGSEHVDFIMDKVHNVNKCKGEQPVLIAHHGSNIKPKEDGRGAREE